MKNKQLQVKLLNKTSKKKKEEGNEEEFMINDDYKLIETEKEEKQIGNYILEKEIGSGGFAKVYLGTHIPTNSKVAIKTLNKILFIDDKINSIRFKKEVEILKKVKHQNIARLYEVIETPSKIYLIMEYCSNGELLNYILSHNYLDEKTARHYFQQYINAINYLHSQNICHRDIKPENLLLDRYKNIKLIDFGISTFYNGKKLLSSPCGTIIYAPPEMHLNNNYSGILSDIWNCGIVLYAMVCGYLPFCDDDDEVNISNIIKGNYNIPDYLSPSLKDLLSHLLEVDPMKRFDLEQIILHPWFNLKKNTICKGIIVGVNKIPIDCAIVKKCLKIYPGKENTIKKSIENNLFNEYSSTYYIFLNKLINIGYESVSDLKSKKFFEFINNPDNRIYNENNIRCNSSSNVNKKKKTKNFISPKQKLNTINSECNRFMSNSMIPPLPHLDKSRNKKFSSIRHFSLNQNSIDDKIIKNKNSFQSFSPISLINNKNNQKKKLINPKIFNNNNKTLLKNYLNTTLENNLTIKNNSIENNFMKHTIITNRNASYTIRNPHMKKLDYKIISLKKKIEKNIKKKKALNSNSSFDNKSLILKSRRNESYSPNSNKIYNNNSIEKKIKINKKNFVKKQINVKPIKINRRISYNLNDSIKQNSINNFITINYNENNYNNNKVPNLYKGIIDISCIITISLKDIIQKIIAVLNYNKILFAQINLYKFHCSKNGNVFEIRIFQIEFKKNNPLYYLAFYNKSSNFKGKLISNVIKNCIYN